MFSHDFTQHFWEILVEKSDFLATFRNFPLTKNHEIWEIHALLRYYNSTHWELFLLEKEAKMIATPRSFQDRFIILFLPLGPFLQV